MEPNNRADVIRKLECEYYLGSLSTRPGVKGGKGAGILSGTRISDQMQKGGSIGEFEDKGNETLRRRREGARGRRGVGCRERRVKELETAFLRSSARREGTQRHGTGTRNGTDRERNRNVE